MRRLCRLLGILLSGALLLTVAAAADDSDDPTDNAQFYNDLAQLISQQDDSAYFGAITMQVGGTTLDVDGTVTSLDSAPEVIGETLMLPIRAVAEAAGAEVHYDGAVRSAVVNTVCGDEIICPIGETAVRVNGRAVEMGTPSYIHQGRTYLSAAVLDEALAMEVEWDKEQRTVTITAPWQTARILVMAEDGQTPDTTELHAKTILHDGHGFWVMQFAAPMEAKTAAAVLIEQGFLAEADAYLPPEREVSIENPDPAAEPDASSATPV